MKLHIPLFLFIFSLNTLVACSVYETTGREEIRKNGSNFSENKNGSAKLDFFKVHSHCSFEPFDEFSLSNTLPLNNSRFVAFLTTEDDLVILYPETENLFACKYSLESKNIESQIDAALEATAERLDTYLEL